MFNKLDIVDRIVNLLEERNITAKKFAEDMGGKGKGYSKDTVYTWKNNRSTSYMNDIERIAQYFSVTAEYLLVGLTDNPTPPRREQAPDDKLSRQIARLSPEQKERASEYIEFLKSRTEFAEDLSTVLDTVPRKPSTD